MQIPLRSRHQGLLLGLTPGQWTDDTPMALCLDACRAFSALALSDQLLDLADGEGAHGPL